MTRPPLPGQPHIAYSNQQLMVEGVAASDLAKQHGTPLFVYSKAAMLGALAAYQRGFAGRKAQICYAMKANSSLAVLQVFARAGCGFDIVSGGELQRVLAAGGNAAKVIFSGVGKTRTEMQQALDAGIGCFNVESDAELDVLSAVAVAAGKKAPVSIRVNPNVDPKTHPYISTGLKGNKFGVAHEDAVRIYQRAAGLPGLHVVGIDCHGDVPPEADALWAKLLAKLDARGYGDRLLMVEPGRSLVGNAGICLTEVLYIKPGEQKNFCIIDAAMNDLPRPAMYQAFHQIVPLAPRGGDTVPYDVVGPVCESGDWIGRDRDLAVQQGDLLAVLSAGAYCMSMSSNYNTRGRAAEVLVDGNTATLIRVRENAADQMRGESLMG